MQTNSCQRCAKRGLRGTPGDSGERWGTPGNAGGMRWDAGGIPGNAGADAGGNVEGNARGLRGTSETQEPSELREHGVTSCCAAVWIAAEHRNSFWCV